jgi:hypothetical protein
VYNKRVVQKRLKIMEILAKTIYAETKKDFERQKKEIIEEFERFGIEYGIIEGEHGYYASVSWTL